MYTNQLRFICAFLFVGTLLLGSCKQHEQGANTADSARYVAEDFSSKLLNRNVPYNSYYPLQYKTQTKLPIVYLLHGHGGDRDDWFQNEEGNVAFLLDSLIADGAIPPVIAVSISAKNTWYVDSEEQMERFYLSEFIPYLNKKYHDKKLDRRIIAGNSAGGYGALRFALKRPELFDEVVLLSPASYEPLPPAISSSRKVAAFAVNGVFKDSMWNHFSYTHLLADFEAQPKHPNFYLSVGDDDAYNIVPVVSELQQLFISKDIKNELRITNGGHDWECWRANFIDAMTTIFAKN